ncbi:hypothetical protein KGP36_02565 [Patescibacteria group bacterium]|nr:hypothetical protein [Patescibacteria group bacterium]
MGVPGGVFGEQQYLNMLPDAKFPEGDILVADFGARGWNPTQPDEQLLATSGAPAASFSVAAAAPFASPEMHDVDFWNGYLNKRNGRTQIGANLGAAPVLGLFKYVYSQASGVLNRLLVAVCNSVLAVYTNGAWNFNLALLNWQNATYAFFTSVQNQLIVFAGNNTNYAPVPPVWWDGSSAQVGLLGNRVSPYYLQKLGKGTYFSIQIQGINVGVGGAGPTIVFTQNQAASGVYIGMTVWIDNGTYMETAVVNAFTTSGTAGTANYYILSMVLASPLQYSTQAYTRVSWNAAAVSSSNIGGSINITGNATTMLVMAVTTLRSGGQRTSIFSVDVPTGGQSSIQIQQLPFKGGDGAIFGNDLVASATQWFLTPPFNPQTPATQVGSGPNQIFYQVPASQGVATNIDSADGATAYPGYNPAPNSINSVSFFTAPDPNTWQQTTGALGIDAPGYLTGQIDAPCCQFGVAWLGFLVMAGDPLNPSRIYISPLGAPQVWGTQGGLDGTIIDVPEVFDGQVITSLYVGRNGYLYVGKTNSLYAVNFTGNTSVSPFQVNTCNGRYGPISPFVIEESDNGIIYFLSASGIAGVNAYTVNLLPQNTSIRARLTGPNAYDFAAMGSAQAFINPTKGQMHFQCARANPGDDILVFDWIRATFWHDTPGPTAQPAQCYTALTEDLTLAPAQIYAGDGQGNVWQLDVTGADETIPIDFYYETPWLHAGDPASYKQLKWLSVGGTKQGEINGTTPTLNVAVYLDFQPKAVRTFTFDMTKDGFPIGHNNPGAGAAQDLELKNCKYFKIVLMNNQPNVPVAIRFMKIHVKVLGPRL